MNPLPWKAVFRFWLWCAAGVSLAALVLVLERSGPAGVEEALLFTPVAALMAAILALIARRTAPLLARIERPRLALAAHGLVALASGVLAAAALLLYQGPAAGAFSFPPLLPFVVGALAAYFDVWLVARRKPESGPGARALQIAALVGLVGLAPLGLVASLRAILQPEQLQVLVFVPRVGSPGDAGEIADFPGAAEAIRAAGLSGDMRLISSSAYGEGRERTVILFLGKKPAYNVQIPLKAAPATVARVDGDAVEVWPSDADNLPERFLIVDVDEAGAPPGTLHYYVDLEDGARNGGTLRLD